MFILKNSQILLFSLILIFFNINSCLAFADKSGGKLEDYFNYPFDKYFDVYLPKISREESGFASKPEIVFSIPSLSKNKYNLPNDFNFISDIFQINVLNSSYSLTENKAILKSCYFSSSTPEAKFFYFDGNKNKWVDANSKKDSKGCILMEVDKSFVQFALFDKKDNYRRSGLASWYNYKKGLYGASTDFPIGTKLIVTNIENRKSVEIVVNDYGPDKNIHPDRVVDLQKEAFSKIAKLSDGVVQVRIDKFLDKEESKKIKLGKSNSNIDKIRNSLKSKSFILVDAEDGKEVFGKNINNVYPIASLTKIVSIDTFLNLNTGKNVLNKKFIYKRMDLEESKKYCGDCSLSKINFKDGEKILVKDLILSAMISSANNAVMTLVRNSGLRLHDFIDTMNREARKNGTRSVSFVEPTGISSDNVSSAKDYALLVRKILKSNNTILRSGSLAQHKFNSDNGEYKIKNTNTLIGKKELNILFTKTGHNEESGFCLTSYFEVSNKKFLAVSLGAKSREESLKDFLLALDYLKKVKK